MAADVTRHPLSAAFGDIAADEFAELVADIKANGLILPIVYLDDEQGHKLILDGWHRHRACLEAGVKPRFEPFSYFVEHADEQSGRKMTPAEFVIAQNAHRRHLTREQRRNIVAELLKCNPEASNVSVAKQAEVDDKTVAKVRAGLEATSEIPRLTKTIGRDGKARPARQPIEGKIAREPAPPPAADAGTTQSFDVRVSPILLARLAEEAAAARLAAQKGHARTQFHWIKSCSDRLNDLREQLDRYVMKAQRTHADFIDIPFDELEDIAIEISEVSDGITKHWHTAQAMQAEAQAQSSAEAAP